MLLTRYGNESYAESIRYIYIYIYIYLYDRSRTPCRLFFLGHAIIPKKGDHKEFFESFADLAIAPIMMYRHHTYMNSGQDTPPRDNRGSAG